MASKREFLTSLRVARQLRRVRSLYTAGAVLWAAAAAWAGWLDFGSQQMWVCVLLLTIFTGLLTTASVWIRQLPPIHQHGGHESPRRAVTAAQ
ncbi:hypothetical protein ACFYYB_26700 [Streptomyces sp. NPDC002886]|uniref:hypothetical protein n=1 Tax=Streptomyces sp. NPDC002886 TaxID=3364667 RepID=UPI003695D26B